VCSRRRRHQGAVQRRRIRTDAVLSVPVQLEARRTGTLVAPQAVDAAVLAAAAVYTALVDICQNILVLLLLLNIVNYVFFIQHLCGVFRTG